MPESTKSSPPDASLWAVVLAGGVGSRFWPVSTPERPKQLLPLGPGDSLIADTIARIEPLVGLDRIRILAGRHLADPIRSAVPGLTDREFMVEPAARGTAPVLLWAAHEIAKTDPDAVMVSLHSDHVIRPESVFRTQIAQAADVARRHGRLLTLGVTPTRPESGYGYIRTGELIDPESETFTVAQFVEKPTRETAGDFVRRGYLWNSGIFVLPVTLFMEEIRRVNPEITAHMHLLAEGRSTEFFESVPTVSVDEGVFERSDRVAVMPARFDWDDVGAWNAVGRTRHRDSAGNVTIGDVALVDSENCIAWAEDGSIVVFGARDLVVVRAGGVTFVAPREKTPDLKDLLKHLPVRLRDLRGNE